MAAQRPVAASVRERVHIKVKGEKWQRFSIGTYTRIEESRKKKRVTRGQDAGPDGDGTRAREIVGNDECDCRGPESRRRCHGLDRCLRLLVLIYFPME